MKRLILSTKRLSIRNLKSSDLDDFYFYRSNPEVTKYQGFDVFDKEEAAQFIEGQKDKEFGKPGEWVQYGVELAETGKLVGDCAIKLCNDVRIAEVGMTISHAEQNKGYAREAMICVLDFLFSIEGFHRVKEIVDAENAPAIHLLKSIGFRQEGHFIENIFFNGKWGSEYQLALLRSEWEKRQ